MATARYPFGGPAGPGPPPLPRVRRALPTDGPGMGAILVDARRAGHRTSVPDADLDSLDPARRARWWSRTLAQGGGAGLCPTPDDVATAIVVEEGGTILALCLVGPVRPHPVPDPVPGALEGSGEIWAFNVAPEAQARGIGKFLLAGAEEELRTRGCRQAVVWVVDRNQQLRRFYERAGWAPDGAEAFRRPSGSPIRDVRYRRAL